MSKAPQRYLITSALPYANGPLHIGHIAGAYLPADTFVRFLRMKGEDVLHVCGSDEHGAAITMKARQDGISPKAIVNRYHTQIKQTFKDFGIDFDIYHRTSDRLHHKVAQHFFSTLHEKGAFVQKESRQYFDVEAEQFLADRYIVGTCPKCGYDEAYGDQCEQCGSTLSPEELIAPKSKISGSIPILKATTHWYLPMAQHQAWIKAWIEEGELDGLTHHNPNDWKSNVRGQCGAWLDAGLQARSMTRDLDWGVKVPLPNAKGKVLYVWLDAPLGYISATQAWAKQKGKNWEDYWKNPDTKLIHFIGKDNIVFHCIIFPIILKTYGDKLCLPENVPANEFLNLEGSKISTSRNWAVWLHEYLKDFPGKQDSLRYVLTSIAPENKDSEFTWKDFQAKNNNELVAILGNFVHRTLILTHKYFKGEVPVRGDTAQYDRNVLAALPDFPPKIAGLLMRYKFREAQAEMMNLARMGNKYLADTQPWKFAASDPEIVKTILNIALQICANLAVLMRPFLPKTAEKLTFMLGLDLLDWQMAGKTELLYAYDKLGKPELLFEKIEDKTVELQRKKLEKTKLSQQAAPNFKPETDFDAFMKMDIRVGTIIYAEKVAHTKKLLLLKIQDGHRVRTIVSGIAQYYEAEKIIDRQVCFLANLTPRKIKDIPSEGMVLMVEDRDGTLSFMEPGQKVFDGSIVG